MKKQFLNFLIEQDVLMLYILTFARDNSSKGSINTTIESFDRFLNKVAPDRYITDGFAWQYDARIWVNLHNEWVKRIHTLNNIKSNS